MMRIAIDAMGSDNAPYPEVRGAVKASESPGLELILVGNETKLRETLGKHASRKNISIVHASEVITMEDSPMLGVRKKKDASLSVAMRLVKQGAADAVVSAGNTGAVMMAARTILRPIQGVARPPICQLLPTSTGRCLVLDLGANVDCNARHLCDFAEMGVVYSTQVLGNVNPRVGLLNIGEEQAKGNDLAKTVHRILSAAPHVNFIGNIEPKALFKGAADIVVCDGFVGNVVLKTSEAAGSLVKTLLTRELKSSILSIIGAVLSRGAYKRLKRVIDPNEYPGAPLLGVNGIVIILHGACSAKGVANAIKGAELAAKHDLINLIRDGLNEVRVTEESLDGSTNESSDNQDEADAESAS
ncbi:MAG: phosphate acyltransferase PlsX [Candidatus Hydrogenedentes bacterium]|nr:phosphate acyltransferase PlsX [Candidatus Hydrogenedentota bacterium]